MRVQIDYHSSEPICQQVVGQIKLLIVQGTLAAGDRLPSIRQLALELHINPTTVTRIYGQLEGEGVITLRQGQGAFVAEGHARLPSEDVRRGVQQQARTLLVEALRQGLGLADVQRIIEEEHRRIRGDST